MQNFSRLPLRAPEGQAAAAEPLPQWDLTDLYAGPESPEITADLERAEASAKAFADTYAGHLAALGPEELAAAIAEYERIEERLARLSSYAQLLFASDSTNPLYGRFYQTITERTTAISSRLLFFTLELNQLDDAALAAKLAHPALAAWQPWLRDVRLFRPHLLSEELERLLHEKEVTGPLSWMRLFDETIAGLRIPVAGEELTLSLALDRLSHPERAVREAAGRAIGETFQRHIRLFSLIINTLAKDKHIVDTWRRYSRPVSYRNLSNVVEDEVVDALAEAVAADYGRLSHRYYALKAKWLGLPKLQHWDRNAPLSAQEDRHISWQEAKEQVLSAYARFSPVMAEIAERFFTRPWIDAALRPGKASGAFAHPTVPSAHPYVLLNYHARVRDVMTLAHELGHAVHQTLAAEQG